MPKLAAMPKDDMTALCKDGTKSLAEWFEEAVELNLDGLEMYAGYLELQDPASWPRWRELAHDRGLAIPMLCCSPDFTHPDPAFREEQIAAEKAWIDMAAALGANYCRVLSGQRRPEVSREEGIQFTVDSINACLPHARANNVTLIIENHYKDDFWEYPEFAQFQDVFVDLVARIDDPNFGVNYDPSNTILAAENPIDLLRAVAPRVVTMHASDRYLTEGTIEDLRKEEAGVEGYAQRLRHGEIGQGLNDYDAIFSILKENGFSNNWISIEDGVDGPDQLARSAEFLRKKITQHWP